MSSKMLHYGTISAHMITSGWYNKVDMSFIPVSLKKKKKQVCTKILKHVFEQLLSFFKLPKVK